MLMASALTAYLLDLVGNAAGITAVLWAGSSSPRIAT